MAPGAHCWNCWDYRNEKETPFWWVKSRLKAATLRIPIVVTRGGTPSSGGRRPGRMYGRWWQALRRLPNFYFISVATVVKGKEDTFECSLDNAFTLSWMAGTQRRLSGRQYIDHLPSVAHRTRWIYIAIVSQSLRNFSSALHPAKLARFLQPLNQRKPPPFLFWEKCGWLRLRQQPTHPPAREKNEFSATRNSPENWWKRDELPPRAEQAGGRAPKYTRDPEMQQIRLQNFPPPKYRLLSSSCKASLL